MKRAMLAFPAVILAIGLAQPPRAAGDWITQQISYDQFGPLVSNTSDGICAAAATINSFSYLAKQFGVTGLIPNGDYNAARDSLAYGWDAPGQPGLHRSGIYGGGAPCGAITSGGRRSCCGA